MGYMSQEKKAVIAAELKKVMPKGWKYSLAVRHHSTIVLTIAAATVDLLADLLADLQGDYAADVKARRYHQVNPYHLETQFSGELLATLEAIRAALNTGNWDRSDSQTDYFDVGHYVEINVGRWNKPFEIVAEGASRERAPAAAAQVAL